MNCNNPAVVEIKKIINGGYGLARLESGKTVLVQFSLPGETVVLDTIEHREHLDHARAAEISRPHIGRVPPPCPYYGTCGGCDLQHGDYPTQCLVKENILADLFERSPSALLKEHSTLIQPIIPSAHEFGYRQRIRLKMDGRYKPGFNRFRSHNIIPVKRCLLAPEIINRCLEHLRGSATFSELARLTEQFEILLNPLDGAINLLFHLTRPPRPADRDRARSISREIEEVKTVFFVGQQFALAGPYGAGDDGEQSRLNMSIPLRPPMLLSWEVGGFCQVNFEQNQKLIELVLAESEVSAKDEILDLYCGMGNFSVPLARTAGSVHGIESQGSAIRSAVHNSNRNGLLNTFFEKSDVQEACTKLVSHHKRYDTVVCDPPRQGMPGLAPLLTRIAKRRIVYISCDPATLCRDLAGLCQEGFTIKTVQPIDMFPQTHHIETIVVLEKN